MHYRVIVSQTIRALKNDNDGVLQAGTGIQRNEKILDIRPPGKSKVKKRKQMQFPHLSIGEPQYIKFVFLGLDTL